MQVSVRRKGDDHRLEPVKDLPNRALSKLLAVHRFTATVEVSEIAALAIRIRRVIGTSRLREDIGREPAPLASAGFVVIDGGRPMVVLAIPEERERPDVGVARKVGAPLDEANEPIPQLEQRNRHVDSVAARRIDQPILHALACQDVSPHDPGERHRDRDLRRRRCECRRGRGRVNDDVALCISVDPYHVSATIWPRNGLKWLCG
jgi:hypothetical protein